jgi:hypothetical protein
MGSKTRRFKRYELFGRTVNAPEAVAKVKGDVLPVPENCRFCTDKVELVNNATFYGGREYGWPLAYCCTGCGARVGTHPNTDIPLGTLADKATIKARIEAHSAFDPLWQGKTSWHRSQAYQALAKAMGKRFAHISWMDEKECRRVVELCRMGALQV